MQSDSPMSESAASAARAPRESTLRNSGRLLLNLFCAAVAGLWIALMAITFSDNTPLILVATFLWLFAAAMPVLLLVFLSRRLRSAQKAENSTNPVQIRQPRFLLILLIWIVVTCIVSNSLVGIWQSKQRLWSGFVFNIRYGWYPEPNLVKRKLQTPQGSYLASTDNFGHRNSHPYPASGRLPIVVQGDSNTFGFGLDDDETLAALLNARLEVPQVYNLGVPGFDLNQYFYQYEELSAEFQMETRIIHWNIGNDFTLSALETPNYFRRAYLYVEAGQVRQSAAIPEPYLPVQGYGQSFIPPFRQYDDLIRATAYDWAEIYPISLIQLPLTRQLIRTYHPKFCQAFERLGPRRPQLELYNPSWMLLKRQHWPQPYADYARDFPVLLSALKKQNPHLILCPFPFREQIIPDEYAAQRDKLLRSGHAETDLDPLAFNAFLKEACEAEGIRLIDPTPEFLAAENPKRLYQEGDQHLSVEGMTLCADALLRAGIHLPDD